MTNDELRRKIAEAKGWTIIDEQSHIGVKDKSGLSAYEFIPNWPVNIVDAWELVEEMRNEHEIDIASDKLSDGSSTYCMKIFTFRGDGKGTGWRLEHITTADTAPRAICLAWLEWKLTCSANSDSTP